MKEKRLDMLLSIARGKITVMKRQLTKETALVIGNVNRQKNSEKNKTEKTQKLENKC